MPSPAMSYNVSSTTHSLTTTTSTAAAATTTTTTTTTTSTITGDVVAGGHGSVAPLNVSLPEIEFVAKKPHYEIL